MGGAASVEAPPYASVAEALADGRTQNEVDSYLALKTNEPEPGQPKRVQIAPPERSSAPKPKPALRRTWTLATESLFPLFVVKTSDFLRLERMRPHGELVEAGIAVEWEPETHGPINFLSHQWLSSADPDPDGVQLRWVCGACVCGGGGVVSLGWWDERGRSD